MDTNLDELALPSGFGAPSGAGAKVTYFKLGVEDDSMCLRVLPSMKGLLSKREIGVFRKLHYGWQGRNVNDPSKTSHRPFLCIEEKSNGMTKKECPACKLRAVYQNKSNALILAKQSAAEKVKAAAKAKNITDENKISAAIARETESIDKELQPITKWLKDHGVDGKFTFYAMNKAGTLGIGQIPYGLKKKFMAEKAEIEKKNYPKSIAKDREVPIQVNGKVGVYFNFVRTGRASNTSDTVKVNTVPFGDEGGMRVDYHSISLDLLNQAKDTLPCLVEEVENTRISDDKVEKLVQHCIDMGGSCDPDVVDEIMGSRIRKPVNEIPMANDPLADFAGESVNDVPLVAKSVETPKAAEKPVEKPVEAKVEAVNPPVADEVVNGADATDDQFDALFN